MLTTEQVLEVQEMIARGDSCPNCGAPWRDAPQVGRGAREMTHEEPCSYWASFTALARAEEDRLAAEDG